MAPRVVPDAVYAVPKLPSPLPEFRLRAAEGTHSAVGLLTALPLAGDAERSRQQLARVSNCRARMQLSATHRTQSRGACMRTGMRMLTRSCIHPPSMHTCAHSHADMHAWTHVHAHLLQSPHCPTPCMPRDCSALPCVPSAAVC
eukprot:363325-Chlamydomonas_euryale.AAC.5